MQKPSATPEPEAVSRWGVKKYICTQRGTRAVVEVEVDGVKETIVLWSSAQCRDLLDELREICRERWPEKLEKHGLRKLLLKRLRRARRGQGDAISSAVGGEVGGERSGREGDPRRRE